MDVSPAMDVTVYPPPHQPLAASDHTRLGQLSYPDSSYGTSKVRKEGEKEPLLDPLCFPLSRTEDAFVVFTSPCVHLHGRVHERRVGTFTCGQFFAGDVITNTLN